MRRFPRKLRIWLLALAGIGTLVVVLGIAIFQSAWFYELVRQRIVREVENATGGHAEIASYSFRWSSLTVEVNGFVLHGSEAAGQDPLFRADSIRVRLRILSMLERQVDLASIDVLHPRGHVLIRPDG